MSHTPCNAITLAALLLAGPSALRAQEPDSVPPPPAEEPAPEPDRWGAEAGFSLNGSGGNENLTVLIAELGLTHLETESYELSFDSRFRYGRSEGREVANSVRGSLTADIRPGSGWSPFVFATAEHDLFRKLKIRLSSGTGVKRTLYRRDWDEVSISGAVLYDYEKTRIDPGLDAVTYTGRWSWRGRARHQIRDGTRFEQVAYFLPAWNEFSDYLLEARSSGRVALTRALAVTATAIYERDSTPAPEVGPDDWSIAVGLSLATAW